MMRPAELAGLLATTACLLGTLPAYAQDQDIAARIAAARERIAALSDRSSRISDQNQIENLQRSFGFYYDKMLWEEVLDLMTDDASFEIGQSGVYRGKDSIRGYLYALSGGQQGPLKGVLFEHMQLQPIVTISDDGQSAQGRWRALIMTGTYGSGSGGNWGEGPYENEYVKENGVWKISKLHWYGTFIAPYEGGWLEADSDDFVRYSVPEGVTPDAGSSTSHAPFPATSAVPYHFENPGREN